jgi:hypothetical protein
MVSLGPCTYSRFGLLYSLFYSERSQCSDSPCQPSWLRRVCVCVRADNRLDMFYVVICIIATLYLLVSCLIWFLNICIIASPYSPASCLIRFSSLHTCLTFTSPRFYALPKVQHTCSKNAQLSSATSFPSCCTNTRKNHRYNTVADDSCTSNHLLSWNWQLLATKKVKKFEKVNNFASIHTLRSLLDQWEMYAKFGSNSFRYVVNKVQTHTHAHTQSNKQTKTFSFIYKIYISVP